MTRLLARRSPWQRHSWLPAEDGWWDLTRELLHSRDGFYSLRIYPAAQWETQRGKEILLSLRMSDPRGLGKERTPSDNHCFSKECHFWPVTPLVKAVTHSKCHEMYFSSQLLQIFYRFSWKPKSPSSGKRALKHSRVRVSAGAQLCGDAATQHPTAVCWGTNAKSSARATTAASAILSVEYLDSLTFRNCSLRFYSCISEALLGLFFSHIAAYFTFSQVGHEVSDALSMGKKDHFIAMTHTIIINY